MKQSLQFYNWEYPSIDENVIVKVLSNDDEIITAELLEYNKTGLLIIKETKKKAFKKLKPLISIGNKVVVNVSDINDENITLHLNYSVSQDMSLFNQNSKLVSIFETISHKTKIDFDILWKTNIYPLQDKNINLTTTLIEKAHIGYFDNVINEIIMDKLITKIKHKVITFKIINPNDDGICRTKKVLTQFVNENNVEIKLVKTPEFQLIINDDQNEDIIKNKLSELFNESVMFQYL